MKWLQSLALTLTLFFSLTASVEAHIIISEVMANPLEGPEWVELYNNGEEEHDLTSWQLKDTLTSPAVIFTFPESSVLSPQETIVIELAEHKLNNTGDTVVLLTDTGVEVDHLAFSSATKDYSWQKSLPTATLVEAPANPGIPTYVTASPSPSPSPTVPPSPAPSSSPLPSATPPQAITLKISQASPCPTDNSLEWVAIVNMGEAPIDLAAVILRDTSTKKLTLDGTLPPGQSQTVYLPTAILNNSGDTIILETPTGTLLDSQTYTQCTPNQIFTFLQTDAESDPLKALSNTFTNPDTSTTTSQSSTTPSLTENVTNVLRQHLTKLAKLHVIPQILTFSMTASSSSTVAPQFRAERLGHTHPPSTTSTIYGIVSGLLLCCAGYIYDYHSKQTIKTDKLS